MAEKHSIDELNRLFTEGENCDKDIFAEQRSNILLVAGEHYNKKNSKFWTRIRDSKELSSEQKLRLTKNHLHKISNIYVNNIISQAPSVTPVPNNPKELQDQKAAELNKAVWEYAKEKLNLRIRTISAAKEFFDIGEVVEKIYWDPMAGRLIGYEQEVDELGQPVVDEFGQPVSSGKAVFSGDLVIEQIYAFNLIRAAEAKSMAASPWLCYRKMVSLADLKNMVGDDEEKQKMIQGSQDETFLVFDGSKMAYGKNEKNQALVKEFYFKPCYEYPNGYFYITVQGGILFEGELPFGIFPIVYAGCDEVATTPRHRSPLKQARPYQIEINRAFSKMAEHQVSLGDDKVILQNGSKVTSGPHLPGIRTMYVTGMAPTILEGRAGNQYLEYGISQIAELYQIMGVAEDTEEKDQGGADPFANLYKSIRQKKKFAVYAEKFENFLKMRCKTYLELAKHYFDENMLIPAIGRSEYINIAEFKSQEPLCYQIKIEPMSDDIETMMGRHLTLNHILQYSSQQLSKDDIGKIIKLMPFANHEEAFSDLTIDYDTATNIILALDRGEVPMPNKQDNGAYILKRLSSRQKQSDYMLLDNQIKANYDQMIQYYEQIEAQKAADIKAAQSEFIPASGAMIKVDYYIPDPTNKTRSIRATLPAESIDWLIKQLSAQGSSQEALTGQTGAVQADIARMLTQNNGTAQPGMTQPFQSIQGGL